MKKKEKQNNNNKQFSIKNISPKTDSQLNMIKSYFEQKHIVAFGSAGTGKTYIACYLALRDVFDKVKDKIIIIRSAVPTREMGYLPGSLESKSSVYTQPYIEIFNDLLQNENGWKYLINNSIVNFNTTSFIRGVTIENSVVIIDEFQNLNKHELYSLLTRMGENTQIILCGDTKQTDLRRETSCFEWLMTIADILDNWFEKIYFSKYDIIRSDFVKDLIIASEDLDSNK